MAGTIKKLAGPAYVASSATDVYVPAANKYGVVRHIHLCNKDSSARTVSLYVGATGGSAGGTELFKDKSIAVGDVYDYWCFLRLSTTDFLSGIASSASTLVITVEGEEYAV
jgi:hypothetical protein